MADDVRTGSAFQSPWAEVVKHGLIVLALCSAFFPLYMMLNISAKTNKEFYAHPWYPSQDPATLASTAWDNYTEGWDLVGASIPNTIFLAVMSTGVTLVAALLCAYVFARFAFPGKTLLWSAL
ncbi:MAG: hypothetical protein ACOCZE_12085, partial [Planctomycetota bacterium]